MKKKLDRLFLRYYRLMISSDIECADTDIAQLVTGRKLKYLQRYLYDIIFELIEKKEILSGNDRQISAFIQNRYI